jgi:hypothetical protein
MATTDQFDANPAQSINQLPGGRNSTAEDRVIKHSLNEFRSHGVDAKAVALNVSQAGEPTRVALLGLGQDKLAAGLFDSSDALRC